MPMFKQFALMMFHALCLTVIVPAAKKCFGEDERKQWIFVVPAVLLALEIGPCLLFLGSDVSTWHLWRLVCTEETFLVCISVSLWS